MWRTGVLACGATLILAIVAAAPAGAGCEAGAPTASPLIRTSEEQTTTRSLIHPVVGVFPHERPAKPLSGAEERALQAKDQFKECDHCPDMIVVPAGAFVMGAPASEISSDLDERPQRRVTIAKPFAVGRFAVTFAEWDACVADGGCKRYHPGDRGWGRGRRPVINLWWEDAKAYLAWLSDKTGRDYRLLSEAEREYVTRAGTTTPFWFGASISSDQANYDGEFAYPCGPRGEYRRRTVAVDAFAPNPWGLYQVHGNVYEWVEDCWNPTYDGAPTDGSAWITGDCARRVMRGGSWQFAPWHLRSAARGAVASAVGLGEVGMRVARSLRR